MADPRTKWEFLYQEALGDVDAIVRRIETLKAELPSLFEAGTGKLNLQIGQLVALAKDIEDRTNGAAENARGRVLQAGIDEVKNAKKAIREESAELVRAALEHQFADETGAVAAAITQLTEARKALQDSAPMIGFWKLVLASLLGGSVVAGIGVAVAIKAPEVFSPSSNSSTLQDGKALEQAWPKLSPSVQEAFRRAFGSTK